MTTADSPSSRSQRRRHRWPGALLIAGGLVALVATAPRGPTSSRTWNHLLRTSNAQHFSRDFTMDGWALPETLVGQGMITCAQKSASPGDTGDSPITPEGWAQWMACMRAHPLAQPLPGITRAR